MITKLKLLLLDPACKAAMVMVSVSKERATAILDGLARHANTVRLSHLGTYNKGNCVFTFLLHQRILHSLSASGQLVQ